MILRGKVGDIVIPVYSELHNENIPFLVLSHKDAPVKVNPCYPQDYDRGMSDHTGDSDNSSSFQYHSHIIPTLQIVEI